MKANIKLGDRARDTISGFEGVVICIANWRNGCQRVSIRPEACHEGKPIEMETFDAEDLVLVSDEAVSRPSLVGGPSIAPTRNPDPR